MLPTYLRSTPFWIPIMTGEMTIDEGIEAMNKAVADIQAQ